MKKKISFSNMRWLLQGGLLVIALVAVIVSIRSLRDPGQTLNLEEIFEDTPAVWDWCPAGEGLELRVLIGEGQEVDAADVCEVETHAVQTGQIEGAVWTPLLKASAPPSQDVILEGDLERGVFRAQGLPFYSPDL
ncbi:MAG TPA: hypothetical protein PL182_09195, partial [Pseudobdellovibrionaceae bacterium]|nr:hypothetical protein [Pseudobdellovibrionaceae bacterium]